MENFFLYRQLRRIEREANDDLSLILEAGPEYYTNEELYELLNELEQRRLQLLQMRRALLFLISGLLLWVVINVYAQMHDITWLSWVTLGCFLFDFIGFLAGSFFYYKKHLLMRQAHAIRLTIYTELDRRRKDALI
jgi:hypothetical protein